MRFCPRTTEEGPSLTLERSSYDAQRLPLRDHCRSEDSDPRLRRLEFRDDVVQPALAPALVFLHQSRQDLQALAGAIAQLGRRHFSTIVARAGQRPSVTRAESVDWSR
jgi:hypothetical protein